jgi:hypothetical protein
MRRSPPSSPCVASVGLRDTLVRITFDNATLVRSNLGGQGGPGTAPSAVDQHIHYRNVGTMPDGSTIDLRVTNLTEYAAYNPSINSISRKANGSFGVINLLGPRTADMLATFVHLRFAFTSTANSAAVALPRSHVT